MSFRYYKSISNHSNSAFIHEFLNKRPEYSSLKYIVQHKYDGSNFQIIFKKQKTDEDKIKKQPCFATRNCLLDPKTNFNNYQDIIQKTPYAEMMVNIQNFLNNSSTLESINLFGEIYGFLNRIRYHNSENPKQKEIRIVFFDACFDGRLLPSKCFLEWAPTVGVPVVETYLIGSLDDCLKFDTSIVKTDLGDTIEGVVIKPYDIDNSNIILKAKSQASNKTEEDTEVFYLKIKNKGFEEIGTKRELIGKSENAVEFKNYINSNRVTSALTKQEWSKKDLAKIAEVILQDACQDFNNDFQDSSDMPIDELKKLFFADIIKLIKKDEYYRSLTN